MEKLISRANNNCELCSDTTKLTAFTVSPKSDDSIENQVAVCEKCNSAINSNDYSDTNHWQFSFVSRLFEWKNRGSIETYPVQFVLL